MEELAALYAMLTNRGVLRPLRFRQSDPMGSGVRLLSEESSFMTIEMLKDNPRPGDAETNSLRFYHRALSRGVEDRHVPWLPRRLDCWDAGSVCAGRVDRQLQQRR